MLNLIVIPFMAMSVSAAIPKFRTKYNGVTFVYQNDRLTWEQGKEYCWNVGGFLAKITSTEDIELVSPMLEWTTWIGIKETGTSTDTFTYMDGTPVTLNNWSGRLTKNKYEPKCVDLFYGDNRFFTEHSCATTFPILCQVNRYPKLDDLNQSLSNQLNSFQTELTGIKQQQLTEISNLKSVTANVEKRLEQMNGINGSITLLTQLVDKLKQRQTNNSQDNDIRLVEIGNDVSYLIQNTSKITEKVVDIQRFLHGQSEAITDVNNHQIELKNSIAIVNQTLISAIEQLHPRDD